ncbi:MAG: RidA family protein [Paenibacillaceae bacterium]
MGKVKNESNFDEISFSQSTRVGNIIFISGQVPTSTESKESVNGNEKKVREAFDKMINSFLDAGAEISDIVKINVFLDKKYIDEFRKIYSEIFQSHCPALTIILQPFESIIQVDGVAIKKRNIKDLFYFSNDRTYWVTLLVSTLVGVGIPLLLILLLFYFSLRYE